MKDTHTFEVAGLGKAPFRFHHYERKSYQACPGAPIQPGGSCKYCGQGITDTYYIVSSDNKMFTVGSTCVNKTGDKGLYNKVQRIANRVKREQQIEREEKRIKRARFDVLEEIPIRHALSRKPHCQEWAAKKGMTMLDWSEWMFANSGHSGKMRVTRHLEKIEKELKNQST